jgi:glycosidase
MGHPLLYEINTRCWLPELSLKHHRAITLATVPDEEFAAWKSFGFTHIWLMGVWTSGPRSRAQALSHPDLRRSFSEVLPGWQPDDVVGSPYAIAAYEVPPALGGDAGLAEFREKLRRHGLRLILDFVPNHLGLDHPWVRQKPSFFIQSPGPAPDTFRQETDAGTRWLAHGKDPYFPGWTDTVQLDYRLPATRSAMLGLLETVADRCDGVRCDMAMLLLADVFERTWNRFPPTEPANPAEFWPDAIAGIKRARPDFLFLAEAYWGLEPVLQTQGFDYTYDKTLYDHLLERKPAEVHHHLLGLLPQFVGAGAHFLENHDERRIAPLLSAEEHLACALVILGLPGMAFLHEGQLSGARLKTPVQLTRRALEPPDPAIEKMYRALSQVFQQTRLRQGTCKLVRPVAAWDDNPTAVNFVMFTWQQQPQEFHLVAVNLAPHQSQCYARLAIDGLSTRDWLMADLLGTESYLRPGPELQAQGLYLDMRAHAAQCFQFTPARPAARPKTGPAQAR